MTVSCPHVPTSSDLRRTGRCLDRRLASVEKVLTAVMKGEALHLQYKNNLQLWSLITDEASPPMRLRL